VIVEVPSLWDYKKHGEGIVAEWYKSEGSAVKKGEIVCLIMVSKIRVEVPSPVDGVVKKIIAKKGSKVKPGDPLMEVEES